MRLVSWFRAPRHLLAWFLVITAVPTIVLFGLGWRLLSDSGGLAQQLRDRLESDADLVVADLRRAVDGLIASDAPLPGSAGALRVLMTDKGIVTHVGEPLLFTPIAAAPAEIDGHAWRVGASAEAQGRADEAMAIYRPLSRSGNQVIRTEALMRLARTHQNAGRSSEALEAYGHLALEDEAVVLGSPAPLEAKLARLRLLAKLERRDDALREATSLRADLKRGRWRIDRTSFENAWQQTTATQGAGESPFPETFALAVAVDQLWREWRDTHAVSAGWNGHRGMWIDDRFVTAVWNGTAGALTLAVASAQGLRRRAGANWDQRGVHVSLLDVDGRAIAGDAGEVDGAVSRAPSGLPWIVRVSSTSAAADFAAAQARRRQLQIVLGLACTIGLMGAYFVLRAVRRELAVARLQSDFVSAVSHEFRTPLTSMSHLLELLKGDRPLDDSRRRRYYDALDQETVRLRGFVDTLLDFGRVESGEARYEMEAVEPAPLVSDIVHHFRAGPASDGRPVEIETGAALPQVLVDRQALGLVLRNLLENAVKYAPGPAAVRVEVDRDAKGRGVAVHVRDDGPGIPRDEQQAVFDKFVRGAAARAAGIRGTGVGLALARQIVRAHGGDIELTSEPGHGSTFTVWLPAAAGTGHAQAEVL